MVTTAGTPVRLFPDADISTVGSGRWPSRFSQIYLEALNANTGFIYVGVSTLVKATLVGVLGTIAAPASGPAIFTFMFPLLSLGVNTYDPRQYWIDADVNGEGVLRTVWVQ